MRKCCSFVQGLKRKLLARQRFVPFGHKRPFKPLLLQPTISNTFEEQLEKDTGKAEVSGINIASCP